MTAVNYSLEGEVAVLTLDHPPVNALSHAVRSELAEGLRRGLSDPAVKALAIIGGAEINEFVARDSKEPPKLQDLQRQVEASPKPVVAAIHGTAVGVGLELALACHARVAVETAQFGWPEVKLGLLPGAGGTVRLSRLVGPEIALDLIASGAQLSAQRACELGVIDEIVADPRAGALAYARKLAGEGAPRTVSALEEKLKAGDSKIFDDFRKNIAKKARGQIAPLKIIDCIETAVTRSFDGAIEFETAVFDDLANGDQHKALAHYFLAERESRKIPGVPADLPTLPIRKAAVIGAGLMGGGIAMVFANAGIPVKILDVSADALSRGLGAIEKNYSTSVSRGSISQERMDKALSMIETTSDYDSLHDVDIVVEAVFENIELKKKIFVELDRATPPRAIFGTNTSSLDIDDIAAATSRQEKVIGFHFFSPANVMKLIENVRGAKTSPETIATAMALGGRLGKTPVLAGNCFGFIGNRMLEFYLNEAEFMLEQGATPEQVDRVAESLGMAMGPFALRDLAGIAIGVDIREISRAKLAPGERMPLILDRLAKAGRFGQKTNKGFYRYEGRNRIPDPEVMAIIEEASKELGIARRDFADEEIRDRLFHPLVNEGAKELEEGIAARAGDIDVVWVNGYGFPAHVGGPMYWGEKCGLERVLETARKLGAQNGSTWQPSRLLEELVTSGSGWSSVIGGKIERV